MTVGALLGDLVTGNFSHAWKRCLDFLRALGLPSWLVNLIDKMGQQEGKILDALVQTAVPDLIKNGLTTAGFVATAKDIFNQLSSQNITTFTLQDIFSALNAAVSAANPPATQAVGNASSPASSAPADSTAPSA